VRTVGATSREDAARDARTARRAFRGRARLGVLLVSGALLSDAPRRPDLPIEVGGPEMAPHTPQRSARPGEARARLDCPRAAPKWPPPPPAPGAPRRSHGAPRLPAARLQTAPPPPPGPPAPPARRGAPRPPARPRERPPAPPR